MAEIDLVGPYTVAAGTTVVFNDTPAFLGGQLSTPPGSTKPILTVDGEVDANATQTTRVAGFAVDYGASDLIIDGSGVFKVVEVPLGGFANGYIADPSGATFVNRGLFSVTSGGNAFGMSTHGFAPGSVDNSGQFTVTAPNGSARGFNLTFPGTFHNSGVISVSGKSDVIAANLFYGPSSFDNSGTITAQDNDPGADSIAVLWNPDTSSGFINSGTLQGDIALIGGGAITNTGQMIGKLQLGGTVFLNSGSVQGAVTFVAGDSVYDGRAGTLTGVLNGGDGNDSIAGGVGAETLFGGAGTDTIIGGAGNDLIGGGRDSNLLDGGGGADTLSYADAPLGVRVDLGAGIAHATGTDTISGFEGVIGGAFADTLTGSAGADTLSGGAGGDWLSGGGNDLIDAGSGDDTISSGQGHNSIDGGAGVDTLVYDQASVGVVVDLSGGVGQDTVTGVEHVIGSAFADTMSASAGGATLEGFQGDDRISGGGGGDSLSGGAGNDLIDARAGDDTISGGQGHDSIDGGAGIDTLTYQQAPTGVVIDLSGGGGQDTVTGVEHAIGSAFADSMLGSAGADTLEGGQGDDRINGGLGDDQILGGEGANYLRGDDGNDSILGGSGFDDINGNKGNDTLDGGSGGGDWLVGGQGDDLITAHAGQNILYGNLGGDTLIAGAGGELMRGGQGNDMLVGGAGNDWLSGDRGNDTISGGAGADTFHTFSGAGLDRVLDFHITEGDKVQVDAGTSYTVNQVGADTVIDMGGGDQMILVGVQFSTLNPGWIFTL